MLTYLMLILQAICFALLLCYIVLMSLYKLGWKLQSDFKPSPGFQPKTVVSIIIPARNEEQNIGACVQSILQQEYPQHLFELIVVDDHSTDNTETIVKSINDTRVKCISLAATEVGITVAYKKKAIEAGIAAATGELVVTTDADCIAPVKWLLNLAAMYEQYKPVMIVAPVDFTSNNSAVQLFQSLDFMSMQGITGAAHKMKLGNMSNGANLAFSKKAFQSVDGYKGIDHLASGDDFLLMHKMQSAFPGRIAYLKSHSAIVRTTPQPDWMSFLQQRIRWASKSGKYDDRKMTAILILVYLFNLSLLILFIAGLFDSASMLVAGWVLLAKIIVEILFLVPVAKFFGKLKQLAVFPFFQPLHIVYIVLAGLLGFVGVYKWKGRTVK
jgi:glycosyltransferase involved in cell wall biosynthesis